MNEHDLRQLEGDAALRGLSRTDDDPSGWSRREFLRAVTLGVGVGALAGSFGLPGAFDGLPGGLRDAWATPPIGAHDGILVVIGMFGGNDGLNSVVPFSDADYLTKRGALAINPAAALPLSDHVGLHPNLSYLKQRWDTGEVAVVQGIGYPNPDLSHFFSMAIWMSARPVGAPSSGWLGRWLDGQGGAPEDFRAASVGTSIPLHVVGEERRAIGVPSTGGGFGTGTTAVDVRLHNGLRALSQASAGRGPWHDMVANTVRTQLDVAASTAPVFIDPLPSGNIERKLAVAARLINADLGLRVLEVNWGGFDSHDGQAAMQGARLKEFDDGLRDFFDNLSPEMRNRVTLMTFSEFGRTPYANGSAGTDHGTASDHFVIGANVRGGVYGAPVALHGLQRWDRPGFSVDLRSYYASVLDGWLGGGSSEVLGGSFDQLGLFSAGPGVLIGSGGPPPPPPPPPPPTLIGPAMGDFVPVTPSRLLDTRNGTGAPMGRIAAGGHIDLTVSGVGSIPSSGVTAVVVNLTGTGADAATFLTAYGAGRPRPPTSSVNLRSGATTPNLAVVEVGESGKVSIYNDASPAHALADVVGYFATTSAGRLQAVPPTRVADTRSGVGVPKGKVGAGHERAVKVTGVGQVPATATAVVLNLTATGATTSSFVSVWPDGPGARPTVSSLNCAPLTPVANLVVAPVGQGGRIRLFNDQGEVHLVADVLGCFVAGQGGRHVSVAPERLLDTRHGVGAPKAAVGRTPVVLKVLDVGGVPVSGVGAVLLNVTVTSPTADTFVTVWPSGTDRPATSNLNAPAGRTVANMVLATVGSGGTVSLYHDVGTAHLIADVVGYFTS